jgi:hypothetical protein
MKHLEDKWINVDKDELIYTRYLILLKSFNEGDFYRFSLETDIVVKTSLHLILYIVSSIQ